MTKKYLLTLLLLIATSACALPHDGNNGAPGQNGTSCSVKAVLPGDLVLANGGAIITCGQTSVLVSNGADGRPGADAILETINPCGSQGPYDEVLLRLADGRILASFSDNVNGYMTRLSIIPPGTFIDTDDTGCTFTVHSDGTVTW